MGMDAMFTIMHLASRLDCAGVPPVRLDAHNNSNFVRTWYRTQCLCSRYQASMRNEENFVCIIHAGVKYKEDRKG